MKTSDFAKKKIGDQTASREGKHQKSPKKKPWVGFLPQKASVLYYGLNKSWISLVPCLPAGLATFRSTLQWSCHRQCPSYGWLSDPSLLSESDWKARVACARAWALLWASRSWGLGRTVNLGLFRSQSCGTIQACTWLPPQCASTLQLLVVYSAR